MIETLQRLVFRVLPDCREAERLQSRRLDEDLALSIRSRLWIHCLMCSCCRRFGNQITFIRRLCREMPEHGDDLARKHALPPEAKERIRIELEKTTAK